MNDEIVSRRAVIEIIRKMPNKIPIFGDNRDVIDRAAAQAEIMLLPPAGTEDTGHWSRKTKVDAYDLCGEKTWGIKCQCDRCTFTTTVVEDFGYYKYCPNCGAKMEV